MKIFFALLLTALLLWKGYHAWRRGHTTYVNDRRQCLSLTEYLLANGATTLQAQRPMLLHALRRALLPLVRQWRLWIVVALLSVLCLQACAQKADLADVRVPQKVTVLSRYAYKSWYSENHRIPLAVSWYLTKEHTYGNNNRTNQEFQADTDVKGVRINTYDYMQSGYDRGHMCPSGDNKWNATAQEQSFLMTNICPQNHLLNKNDWNDLEQLCRTWARRYGRIYIVCGPVLRGTQHKTIGRQRQRRVTVPEAFYKVVMRTGDHPAAIGFVYENNGTSQPMTKAVRTVDEIEQLTGLDFFHKLSDATENRIEAKASLDDWKK